MNQIGGVICASGLVPVVIGVTGHRDLVEEDVSEIRYKVRAELKRIESVAKGLRLILLSGLAEGGDQIVAEEALRMGWAVIAVFPMPFADYLADFTTDDKREALERLKAQCVAITEIPWATALDLDITNPRDQQYRNQSIFIARQAQVVIALWDGIAAQYPGACGAAYVAELCRKGPPPIEGEVLAAPETTSLIHIPVRRKSDPGSKLTRKSAFPSDKTYLHVCKEFSAYNKAVDKMRESSPHKVRISKEWLVADESMHQLDAATRALIDQYAYADALSIDRQTNRNHAVKVASIAMIFGAFAQATNSWLSHTPWMIAYGIAVGAAYGLYLIFFRLPYFRIEDRYLEYRALAEALRVQVFWRMAGLSADAAEHYLQLVKTEVGWVREALRNISMCTSIADSQKQTAIEVAKKFWIDSQAKYFVGKSLTEVGGKALHCKKLKQRFDFAANASLFVGAVLVAIATVASVYDIPASIKTAASAYSAAFFLMAGVIKGQIAVMGYAEQAISYEKMGAIFRSAQRLFEQNPSQREECLFMLGKHALAENADWLMQHRKNAFNVQGK